MAQQVWLLTAGLSAEAIIFVIPNVIITAAIIVRPAVIIMAIPVPRHAIITVATIVIINIAAAQLYQVQQPDRV